MKASFKLWMSASLLTMGLSPQLHAEEDKALIGLGAVVTGVSGVTSAMTYNSLQKIYQNNSQTLFNQADVNSPSLNRSDIPRIAKQVGSGDEIRITYVTSEVEERAIRIQQLGQRRKELRAERTNVRLRLEKLARKGKVIEMNAASIQMRDLGMAIDQIDHQITEIESHRASVAKSVATRVVDLNKVKLKDVETYLHNKLDHGKEVLRVERVPATKRTKAAQLKAAMNGQIAVMLIGAVVTLTQLGQDESLAENSQELEIGDLYVPELKERADLL